TLRLQVLLRAVFRELVVFVEWLARGCWRLFASRRELVLENAGLEGALLAINGRAPRIIAIDGFTPGAVIPDDLQIAKIERGRLRVGDVGFAGLVDEDSPGGTDFFGPT